MINIRQNLFETNSSSVHTFVICKDDEDMNIPKNILLYTEEFGWGPDEANCISYIWTYLLCLKDKSKIKKFINWLKSLRKDIQIYNNNNIDLDNLDSLNFDKINFSNEYDYIDHYLCVPYNKLSENNFEIMKYLLFNNRSTIYINNDNSDYTYGPMPQSIDFSSWNDYYEAENNWIKKMNQQNYIILEKGN